MRHTYFRSIAFVFAAVAAPASAEVISVAARDAAGLAAAIEHANKSPSEDIIELAADSLYAIHEAAEPARAIALPTIRSRIRILGNNAEIRRYADEPLLLLSIAPAGSLRMEHVTLAEGTRGAILNHGTLELHHVKVLDNTATGAEAIVTNYGRMSARGSELSYNEIAGAQRDAGIVLNYGTLDIVDSVLAANSVSRRYRSLVGASAILNLGEARLRDVMVTGNALADALDEARDDALVTLGNGRFDNVGVVLSDN